MIRWALFLTLIVAGCGPQSRAWSRVTGTPVTIKLPEDCVEVISISVTTDPQGNQSAKNVTYISTKGELITKEYTDWGIWQGSIRWVRHDGSRYR